MNFQQYISLIKANSLFKSIAYDDLIKLFTSNMYTISNYKKNSIIHFENEKCINIDIILNGQVIVQRIDENGNILTITDFHSGDSLGGNILFSNYPYYPMTVIAVSDTLMLHIHKDLVLKLCQSNRDFLYEYLTSISDKASILTEKIKAISLKSIRSSIIDFLRYEYHLQKSSYIRLNMTKKELAERLGVQRTSLSRELSKMRRAGLIEFDAHSIKIIQLNVVK